MLSCLGCRVSSTSGLCLTSLIGFKVDDSENFILSKDSSLNPVEQNNEQLSALMCTNLTEFLKENNYRESLMRLQN